LKLSERLKALQESIANLKSQNAAFASRMQQVDNDVQVQLNNCEDTQSENLVLVRKKFNEATSQLEATTDNFRTELKPFRQAQSNSLQHLGELLAQYVVQFFKTFLFFVVSSAWSRPECIECHVNSLPLDDYVALWPV